MILSTLVLIAAGTPPVMLPAAPADITRPPQTTRATARSPAQRFDAATLGSSSASSSVPYLLLGGGMTLFVWAGLSIMARRRRDGFIPPDIDVVASRSLGAKSKVVLLRAQGREVLVGVSEKGMELLADWLPELETPIAVQSGETEIAFEEPIESNDVANDSVVFADAAWIDPVEAKFFAAQFSDDEVTEEIELNELSRSMKEALGDTLTRELSMALTAPEQKPSAESEAIRGLLALRRRRPMGRVI